MPTKDPLDEAEKRVRGASDEDIRMEELQYKEWKGEELTWVLDARTAKYYYKKEEVRFQDVDVIFSPTSEGRIFLHAKKVFYDMSDRLLRAEGEISGENEQGLQLRTDRLFYKADQKEVNTPDKVTFQKDRLLIEGIGMKGSLKDRRFVLLSSVRAVFSPVASVR